MIVLTWPDGVTSHAPTYPQLEQVIKNECVHPLSRTEFRAEMRERGEVWSGSKPAPACSSAEFLRSLAACHLFELADDGQ